MDEDIQEKIDDIRVSVRRTLALVEELEAIATPETMCEYMKRTGKEAIEDQTILPDGTVV